MGIGAAPGSRGRTWRASLQQQHCSSSSSSIRWIERSSGGCRRQSAASGGGRPVQESDAGAAAAQRPARNPVGDSARRRPTLQRPNDSVRRPTAPQPRTTAVPRSPSRSLPQAMASLTTLEESVADLQLKQLGQVSGLCNAAVALSLASHITDAPASKPHTLGPNLCQWWLPQGHSSTYCTTAPTSEPHTRHNSLSHHCGVSHRV